MSKEEWEEVIAKIMKDANLHSLKLEYWTDTEDNSYLKKISVEKEYC